MIWQHGIQPFKVCPFLQLFHIYFIRALLHLDLSCIENCLGHLFSYLFNCFTHVLLAFTFYLHSQNSLNFGGIQVNGGEFCSLSCNPSIDILDFLYVGDGLLNKRTIRCLLSLFRLLDLRAFHTLLQSKGILFNGFHLRLSTPHHLFKDLNFVVLVS